MDTGRHWSTNECKQHPPNINGQPDCERISSQMICHSSHWWILPITNGGDETVATLILLKKGRKIKEKMISKVSGKGGDDCRISTGPGRRRRFTDDVAFFLATVPRWPRRRRRRFSEKEKKTSHFFFILLCVRWLTVEQRGGVSTTPCDVITPTKFLSRLSRQLYLYHVYEKNPSDIHLHMAESHQK